MGGCEELTGNGDTSKVELVSYEVETHGMFGVIGSGFIHGENVYHYRVTGTIKNKAGYKLDRVRVLAKLFDSNGIFLDNGIVLVYGIPDTHTEDFSISFSRCDTDGFENVDSVKFRIKGE